MPRSLPLIPVGTSFSKFTGLLEEDFSEPLYGFIVLTNEQGGRTAELRPLMGGSIILKLP